MKALIYFSANNKCTKYIFFYKQQVYKVTKTDYFEVLTPQMFVHVDWFIGWFLFYLQKTTDNTMSATKFTPFTLLVRIILQEQGYVVCVPVFSRTDP